jgi:phosphatidylinositol glycan class B
MDSTAIITLAGLSDRAYYGEWTFPPYQWLTFNITKSLAVFYGENDWHYYLSQGLPLLLTTYLPFALVAIWSSTSISSTVIPARISNIRFQIAFVVLTMITTLGRISHKEVRFIYPLLPGLHVLAAPHVLSFFSGQSVKYSILNASSKADFAIKSWRLYLLITALTAHFALATYATRFHQRGVIDVLSVLRIEYEHLHLTQRGQLYPIHPDDAFPAGHIEGAANETFAAFLMPCHSTPWRSHLVHSTLHAWALTCEPPIDIPADSPERATYEDEADRFYKDPMKFLQVEVNTKKRPWPRFVVGFEGIEAPLKEYYATQKMKGFEVRRKWEGFNSHWHDDQRRQGNVVIWEFVDASTA